MHPRIAHLRSLGCEVNYYADDDGFRIEICSNAAGRRLDERLGEPTYWTAQAEESTREDAERVVLERFDALGFFPHRAAEMEADLDVPTELRHQSEARRRFEAIPE